MILHGFVEILKQEGFQATIQQVNFNEVIEIYEPKSKHTFIYSLNKNTGKIELYPKKFPELMLSNIDNLK